MNNKGKLKTRQKNKIRTAQLKILHNEELVIITLR